ncbi:MAG TPA: cadherin domain-containing protein [Planctomycetaceae bacterium]|nr:cadherin domain-containing protein [Planctomycetaceae bacterium]
MLIHSWLSQWTRRLHDSPSRPRRNRRRAISSPVQSLEARVLPAATPVGNEFRVNTTTLGSQHTDPNAHQAVAADADGDFVVVWTQGSSSSGIFDVYAQRYNAAGVAQGAEFLVNTTTLQPQLDANVAMDADGDFVVTWTSDYGQDIYAQRYNAAGLAQGGEFLVNTYTTNFQRYSSVAMDDDGDFVITWTSYGQDSVGTYAQRYNAAGVAQGGEFLVNTYTTNIQRNSVVAMDSDGDFAIAWTSYTQDDGGFGIYVQRFNAAGIAQGSETRVNTYTTGNQSFPMIAMDADGDFVVAWSSSNQDGNGLGVYGQRFNAAGVAQGSEFRINSNTTGNQANAAVDMDAAGNFVVTWNSPEDGSTNGIVGQQYNAAGVAQGGNFSVNTYTTNQQRYSSVAMDADGNFVVVWSSFGQDGFEEGVYGQRFAVNQAPVIDPLGPLAISENRPVGYVVGDVNATDPDGDNITYSIIGGDPNAQFAINATTGVITVAKATINFEATPQFLLQVQATDDGDPVASTTQIVTVNINDLNEPPGFLPPTSFTISENRPVGYVVGNVVTSDPENNAVTYSIIGGDPNAQFAINATTGQITVAKATINYEATPQFVLQVRAQDNGTPSNGRTQNITINIADLNEAPTFLPPTTFSIPENSPLATLVGTVQTVDPENQTVTYSITAGNTNNAFTINPLTGQIRVANPFALDFETMPQFLLSVRAADNGNPSNSRTQTITINLTNVADSTAPATSSSTAAPAPAGSNGQQVVAKDQPAASTDEYSFPLTEPLQSFTLFDAVGSTEGEAADSLA